MKHRSIFKRALLSVFLALTLTCTLLSVSAAETDDTAAPIQNPAARLTVTSVETGETTETLYKIAEEAFSAADSEAIAADKTVTVTLLAPMTGYTFGYASQNIAPLTVDLGGFTHYIKEYAAVGTGTLTIRNGTLITAGSNYAAPYGITVNNDALTVIFEQNVTIKGADRNTVVHTDGADDVLIAQTGAIPVRVLCGSLINHGTIIGGASAVAVQNDGGEICNHGTIQGGSGTVNNPASTFDSGIGVDGYYGVKLNTGVIRGGDFTSEDYDNENVLMSAPAVYGIVGENRGEIIGGSIKANSANVTAGPAVYGAVGINTGTIRGGNAHSYAENGIVHAAAGVVGWQELNVSEYGYCEDTTVLAIVIDNGGTITNGQATADHEAVTVSHASTILSRSVSTYEVYQNSGTITASGGVFAIDDMSAYGVVSSNTGTIAPVAFAQMSLDVFIDGAYTAPQTMLWHNGAEHTVTYTLTFGGKEIAFDGITHRLTTQDGAPVSALTEAGKYNLIVTDGETEKKHPIRIRPAHPFDDITESTPYYTDIVGTYQKGLMNGTAPNVFSPDETLTRAMLVTMLWRIEGCPYVNYAMQFTDVAQEEWYSEAIRWAASEGIVLGYEDGSFGTNDPITLEQMSVILYLHEQYKGGGFKGMWMFRLNYEDTADISDWAYEAICYMTMKGIYCKPSETTLQPGKAATRAEAAVFVNRYAEFRAEQDAPNDNP